ncbi:MAG TPA: LptF/LptG family permease [Flavisolibacter sp.]
MFKKLDRVVVRAFIGPFIATFFITLLVLVMQFFWLYIDDFVGKGLSTGIILEFIWYQSAVLVPLALPLAVLLSSLMTFGNLGESYELVAIKSAGISLLRFMQPLFFVTIVICGIAFLFANYMIPVANLKQRTLLGDIVHANPSFDLKEGVFYDKLDGFAIKVGKKEKDSIIRDIIIYERNAGLQDNFIVASDGLMRISENKRYLEFVMKNGWRYEERGTSGSTQTDYIRLGFKEYKRQFDLGAFGLKQRTADSVNRNNAKMLSMRQLERAMDSINREGDRMAKRVKSEVYSAMSGLNYLDSGWKVHTAAVKPVEIDSLVPDTIRSSVQQRISNRVNAMRVNAEIIVAQYEDQERNMRQHQIEWHRKISLSVACLVLFLIGAPLGSIIRKGGLGTPLIFSIIFFMLFYFSSTTGEKFSKEGTLPPHIGMWLSTIFLIPLGLFLTYKAMHDSQLLNKEFYFRSWRRLRAFIRRKRAA